MTANETMALIISTLTTMMAQQGYPIAIQQSYQPTQQGAPIGPFVTVNYVSSRRYGYPQVLEQINQEAQTVDRTEIYWLEETYQITAFVTANPADISSPTAYTYATRAAAVLQSQQARNILLSNGIGFQRIIDIRTPYFQDDRDRQQLAPSFDLVVTRQEMLIYSVPIVAAFELQINRV